MLVAALVAISLGAITLVWFEFRSIRLRALTQKRMAAWPGFVELYTSALQSGISIVDAFSYVNDFNLGVFKAELGELEEAIGRGQSLPVALAEFKRKIATGATDWFVEIVSLSHVTGSQNLIDFLQTHSRAVRSELAVRGAVRARQGAILAVAKMGLLAPWVLVSVLSVNTQNREAFLSDSGGALLLTGFAISVLAYRMIIAAGRDFEPHRVLGATDV